jgi:hypothetical protein
MNIKKQILLFSVVIFCIMLFNSYGHVLTFNLYTYKPFGFMQNFWELWKPSFGVSAEYSSWLNYIQMPFYIFFMVYFIRKVNILSWEFILFLVITLTYTIIHGNARYREPFIMVLILWIGQRITGKKKLLNDYMNHNLR